MAPTYRLWTPEDDARLRSVWGQPFWAVSLAVGRSQGSCARRGLTLMLTASLPAHPAPSPDTGAEPAASIDPAPSPPAPLPAPSPAPTPASNVTPLPPGDEARLRRQVRAQRTLIRQLCIMLARERGDLAPADVERELGMTPAEYDRAVRWAAMGGLNACRREAGAD